MKKGAAHKPQWPLWILKKICHRPYLEEIEGDLEETYIAKSKMYRPFLAKLLYVFEVFSFLRYTLIRKPKFFSKFNDSDMLFNHFIITFRVLSKNKLFTTINIVGLAVGISAFLLITQYIEFENSYDSQHPRVEDIYRVTLSNNNGEGFFASNHPAVASNLKNDFPEVENFARLVPKSIIWGSFILSYTNERNEIIKSNANEHQMYVADASVLEIFDIQLTKGNPTTALSSPESLILSESVAKRFFGEEDPLNKVLRINNEHAVKITGVFKDLPDNTHLKLDILVSFSTLGDWVDTNWKWPEFYNYIRLHPGTDPQLVESKLPDFIDKYMGDIMTEHGFKVKFGLQPVRDIHLKSDIGQELSANANEKTLDFLNIISMFVIGIALINFINLSTAKSVERAKEVGLKKVVGAQKSALIGQFLLESLVVNFTSILISIVLVSLLIQPFNRLVGVEMLSLDIWVNPGIWLKLAVIFFAGGLLAGAYPAFVLSSFQPIEVLKGKFNQSSRGSFLRKSLVILQFAISVALIAGTYIVYSQYSFMQNQDLGYDTKHNLVLDAPMVVDSTIQSKMEVFKSELQRKPGVHAVSMSNDIPGKRIRWLNGLRNINTQRDANVGCFLLTVDHDFIPTYDIELVVGRNFVKEDRTSFNTSLDTRPIHKVIINKTAAKDLGFDNPKDALGKKVIFILGTTDRISEVIGIVDDYHQQSLQKGMDPILLFYPDYYAALYLTVNINTQNVQQTVSEIEASYAAFFPHDPFNSFFLDEYFNRQYQADLKFGKICLLFSGLAIFIAALGLFGLGSYMALQKIKEISIRKVLGASLSQVLMMIPRSLIKLIFISGIIALPLVYFVTHEWLLGYAFRVDVDLAMFLIPFLIVLLIGLLSVLIQSLKVATVNPVDCLKDD